RVVTKAAYTSVRAVAVASGSVGAVDRLPSARRRIGGNPVQVVPIVVAGRGEEALGIETEREVRHRALGRVEVRLRDVPVDEVRQVPGVLAAFAGGATDQHDVAALGHAGL